ncbi:MAG: efflux RND transporter periplasmic adaptor subunit [Candidatus Marinimicrobia bacterium]|nr:efflux RND transporter periplasmic adaptor subunit [Candidatus Neomarinimicrobiota bacterium]
MKKSNRNKLIILIIIVLVLGVVIVANLNKNDQPVFDVETQKIKNQKVVQTITASGTLNPTQQVKVSAKVSAKILEIFVNEGEKVEAGQKLVNLDSKQYEASYRSAQANMKSQEANVKKVLNELRRKQELYEENHISKAELEAVEAQAEMAKSQLKQARASVEQAEDALDKTSLEAPINGIITDLKKEAGEMALGSQFTQDVILIVSDMARMEVVTEVDETDIIDVNVGDSCEIELDALPNEKFSGVVQEIAHSATVQNQGTQEQVTNFEVAIKVLESDKRFRPGMSATVDIITDVKEHVPAIPIQALTIRDLPEDSTAQAENNEEKEVVFVVEEMKEEQGGGLFSPGTKYKAVVRPVKIGISSDTDFEIISGLKQGEEIVVSPYDIISKQLEEGSLLKIQNKAKGEQNEE